MFKKIKKIHFVGIGGIGMSGIAELLNTMNYKVSGSDNVKSAITERLEKLGIKISYSHEAKNVMKADVVVYSSAIKQDNVEIVEAKKLHIPIIPRAEMLAELMRIKFSITVAGSHGKTTTTSMIGYILTDAGLDPTIVVGGKMREAGINARLGKGKYLVAEADESDKSFLKLFPTISVITNIDEEHLDKYIDIDDILDTFTEFANKIPFYGDIYLNIDDNNCRNIKDRITKSVITYGISEDANLRALSIRRDRFFYNFEFYGYGEKYGRIFLNVPGRHNIYNALPAIGICIEIGIPFEKIKNSLRNFSGVVRRFEKKCEKRNIILVDDYAHHPREIMALLKNAREGWSGRIIAIFQPHLYSRTILLKDLFGKSFFDADIVIITDIYPSREEKIPNVTGEIIADAIKGYGHKEVYYIKNMTEIPEFLKNKIKEYDMIITIGAGNINIVAEEICDFI